MMIPATPTKWRAGARLWAESEELVGNWLYDIRCTWRIERQLLPLLPGAIYRRHEWNNGNLAECIGTDEIMESKQEQHRILKGPDS